MQTVVNPVVFLLLLLKATPAESSPMESTVCEFGPTVLSSEDFQNTTTYYNVGGIFSVHQLVNHPTQDEIVVCAMNRPSASILDSFHRFAVEQSEALILATELVNSDPEYGILNRLRNSRSNKRIRLGFVMKDSCGLLENECPQQLTHSLSVHHNATAIILGPYYQPGSPKREKEAKRFSGVRQC
eukprot:m.47504 g.47504  ORF g.47504 m.47504 type:complete len:185 (+) comp33798_c0_seq1:74-628(+)